MPGSRQKIYLSLASLAAVISYLVASGCAWVTFRADPDAGERPAIHAAASINKVYFQFNPCPQQDKGRSCESWQKAVTERISDMGYVLVGSSQEADLSVTLQGRNFTKKDGTLTLFLFVIPQNGDFMGGDPLHDVIGIQARATFVCAGQKTSKVYRAYSDEFLANAVLDDISRISFQPPQKASHGTRQF
jgi:hypothetical protein